MATLSTDVLPEDEMIREAAVEDYQAVLDLEPSGYSGCDYLPATFSFLVEGQGVNGYVYLKQNKVVGFLSTRMVDGGQTVMTSAGRIHPEYRGGGMYGRFKRTVLTTLATSPTIRHVVFAVSNENMDTPGRHLRNYRLVMEKALVSVEMDVEQLGVKLTRGTVHSTDRLHPLAHHHLHSMLSQPPSLLRHLFPQQRILLSFEPFRIMPDNADVIVNSCKDRVLVAAEREVASVDKGDHFPVTLLSCGSHCRCQRGRVYYIDVFGSGPDEEMIKHLLWHLWRLTEVAKEKKAVIKIFTDKRCDDLISILGTQFSWRPFDLPWHTISVLEADLNQ